MTVQKKAGTKEEGGGGGAVVFAAAAAGGLVEGEAAEAGFMADRVGCCVCVCVCVIGVRRHDEMRRREDKRKGHKLA